MHSRIEIKSADGTMTEVFIDGHQVRGVRSLRYEKEAGGYPTLTMDLSALDISIDSPMTVKQKGYEEMEISFKDGCMVFGQ